MAFGRDASARRLALASFACVLGLVIAPAAAHAFPGGNGKIAFSTCCRDGNYEVYSMNADGSVQTNLTQAAGGDLEPVWSADGAKVAFSTDRNGSYDIYTMNGGGTAQTAVTSGSASDQSPAWSPDSGKIVFVSDRDMNYEIYSVNADGTGLLRLTFDPGRDVDPAWSPDGTKIAFSSNRSGNYDLFVMNSNGSGVVQLTNDPGGDREPAWSPDGSKIAFSSNRSGNQEIYSMSAAGGPATNLSANVAFDYQPAWSPDGTKIAFATFRGGNYEVYAMNANGSGQVNLTNGSSNDQSPDWQPAARIVVRKDAQPDDPQDFAFTAGGGLTPASFSLDDDSEPTLQSAQTFDGLSAGSGYSISETVPAGWEQTDASCDDGSPPSNIAVSAAEIVTCTFVNQRQAGTIVVRKDAQPDDPQDFAFTAGGGLSPASFSLDDDSDPTLPNEITFTGVPTGSGYSISETVPAGWEQTGASCDDGSPPSNVDVSAGETVTCTFVNERHAQIVVRKDTVPNDPQDFEFTTGGGLSPSSFSLDDDSDPTLSNTQSFEVAAGNGYSVSESVSGGWMQRSASCDDGSPVSDIDAAPGETVTCTFVNLRYATPGSADTLAVPLVPVFRQCGAGANIPNAAHSPPLAVNSCTPPATTAGAVAHVGSLSTASATLSVVTGDPDTPANEADVVFQIGATDVRAGSTTGSDYAPNPSGPDLTYDARLRITDANSALTTQVPATTADMTFPVPLDCTPTAGPEGSACSANTTANTIVPGAIAEGNFIVIQSFRLQLRDSGNDGVRGNADDRLFEQQGLFTP